MHKAIELKGYLYPPLENKRKEIVLIYNELPTDLKEKIKDFIKEISKYDPSPNGTLWEVDSADEFKFYHKSIENLEKYIKENELESYFFKEAYALYKTLAIFLIEEKVPEFEYLYIDSRY